MAKTTKRMGALMIALVFIIHGVIIAPFNLARAFASGEAIFNDDFKEQTLDAGKWYNIPSSDTSSNIYAVRANDPQGTDNGCMKLCDKNSTVALNVDGITPTQLTGKVTAQFKYMVNNNSGSFGSVNIKGGTKTIANIVFDKGGLNLNNPIDVVGGTSLYSALTPAQFDNQKWYGFKLVIDIPSQKMDVYVDDVLKVKGAYFKNTGVTYLDRINFTSPTWSTTVVNYVDDVIIGPSSDFEVEPIYFNTLVPGQASSTVYLTANKQSSSPVSLITAGYDQYGKMLVVNSTSYNKSSPMQVGDRVLCKTTINTKGLPIANIKSFVWDDLTGIKTIDQKAVIPNPYAVRILCLGDSITQGKDIVPTYRYYLWQKLVDDNYNFDFIGTMSSGAGSTYPYQDYKGLAFDRDHEGHWGWKISDATGTSGINENLPSWMNSYKRGVNIALVQLCTNDVGAGDSVEQIKTEMMQTVTILRNKYPNIAIFIGLPFQSYDVFPQIRTAFKELVNEVNTPESPVFAVDHSPGWVDLPSAPDASTVDFCHPNERGSQMMANNWYALLKPYLDANYSNYKN